MADAVVYDVFYQKCKAAMDKHMAGPDFGKSFRGWVERGVIDEQGRVPDDEPEARKEGD